MGEPAETHSGRSITPPGIAATEALASGDPLIDVRKSAARSASGFTVAGVPWQDPLALGPTDPFCTRPGRLIVFCAHGHEVSRNAAALRISQGQAAAFVIGGFDALVAAGAPLSPVAGDAG